MKRRLICGLFALLAFSSCRAPADKKDHAEAETVSVESAIENTSNRAKPNRAQQSGNENKANPETSTRMTEGAAHAVELQVLNEFCNVLKSRDQTRFSKLTSPNFKGKIFGSVVKGALLGGRYVVRKASLEDTPYDRDVFVKRLSKALRDVQTSMCQNRVTSINASRLGVYSGTGVVSLTGQSRIGVNTSVELEISFDVKLAEDTLALERLVIESMKRIDNAKPLFVDVTNQVGGALNQARSTQRALKGRVDARALDEIGGIAVVDFDNDGHDDVMAWHWHRNFQVLVNDGAGGFHRLDRLLPPENVGLFQVYVDLDGDGQAELVSSNVDECRNSEAQLGIYKRGARRFERITKGLSFSRKCQLPSRLLFSHIEVADLNGDRRPDLIFSGYSNGASRHSNFNLFSARSGEQSRVFINQGNLKFDEQALERGLKETGFTAQSIALDYDEDGDLDIYLSNHFGRNQIFQNDGTGHFAEVKGPLAQFGHTGGLSIADLAGENKLGLYVAGNRDHVAQRLAPAAKQQLNPIQLNDFTSLSVGGRYFPLGAQELSKDRAGSLGLRGRGWNRGALIFDADLNGIPDVFLPSGNSSHSNPMAPDYKTYYWRSMMTAIKDHHTETNAEKNQKELIEAGQFVGSFGGYRADDFLLGQPDRFVSLGALSGVADARDGRASAYFDMDGDGDLDLAVLSLQGLRIYENRLSPKPREALVLQLLTRDGQPALGATATLETATKSKRAQTVRIMNGTRGQQRPWLYFGLGQIEGAPVITIKWPSGESDTLTNLFGHQVVQQGRPPRRVNRRPWPLMTKPRALAAVSPSIEVQGLGGRNHRIPIAGGKPQIVHVLSIDKQRALNEMTILNRLANGFGDRIRILAVFGRDPTADLTKGQAWPFPTARLSSDLKKKLFRGDEAGNHARILCI